VDKAKLLVRSKQFYSPIPFSQTMGLPLPEKARSMEVEAVLRAKFHSGNATLKEARAKGIDVYATSEYLTLNINNILSPKVSPPERRSFGVSPSIS